MFCILAQVSDELFLFFGVTEAMKSKYPVITYADLYQVIFLIFSLGLEHIKFLLRCICSYTRIAHHGMMLKNFTNLFSILIHFV